MARIYSVLAMGPGERRRGGQNEAELPLRLNVFCRESRKSSRTLARTSRLPYVLLTDRRGLVVETGSRKNSIKLPGSFDRHFHATYSRSDRLESSSRVSCLKSIRGERNEFSKQSSRGQLVSVIGQIQLDERVPPFSEWTSDPTIPWRTGMLFIRLRQDHPVYPGISRARARVLVFPLYKRTRALHVGRRRICEGSGHVRGGGTAPFAKLTALDRDPGILYAFLDLRPAILRWIRSDGNDRRPLPSIFFFIAFSSTYHV